MGTIQHVLSWDLPAGYNSVIQHVLSWDIPAGYHSAIQHVLSLDVPAGYHSAIQHVLFSLLPIKDNSTWTKKLVLKRGSTLTMVSTKFKNQDFTTSKIGCALKGSLQ